MKRRADGTVLDTPKSSEYDSADNSAGVARDTRKRRSSPASASSMTSQRPRPENLRQLRDLLTLRRKFPDQLRADLNPQTARCSAATLDALQVGIAACEQRMLKCVDAVRSRRAAIIGSVPGCGRLTAACLCAEMPELGTLGRRQAASLLGLTPNDRDSGQHLGGRHIRGGPAHPRRVLYMAALTAVRWEPDSQARCRCLTARGKPYKVAMVTVMRRLARSTRCSAKIASGRLNPPCTALQDAV